MLFLLPHAAAFVIDGPSSWQTVAERRGAWAWAWAWAWAAARAAWGAVNKCAVISSLAAASVAPTAASRMEMTQAAAAAASLVATVPRYPSMVVDTAPRHPNTGATPPTPLSPIKFKHKSSH